MIALVYQQHNKCLQNILLNFHGIKPKKMLKFQLLLFSKESFTDRYLEIRGGNKTNKRSANSRLNGCDVPDLEVKVEGKTILYQF